MLTTVFAIAFLAALGKLVLLWRFRLLGSLSRFHGITDLGVGMLFAWLFFGTMTGMVIGLLAALIFSAMIEVYRRGRKLLYGETRTVRKGWRFARVHSPGVVA